MFSTLKLNYDLDSIIDSHFIVRDKITDLLLKPTKRDFLSSKFEFKP